MTFKIIFHYFSVFICFLIFYKKTPSHLYLLGQTKLNLSINISKSLLIEKIIRWPCHTTNTASIGNDITSGFSIEVFGKKIPKKSNSHKLKTNLDNDKGDKGTPAHICFEGCSIKTFTMHFQRYTSPRWIKFWAGKRIIVLCVNYREYHTCYWLRINTSKINCKQQQYHAKKIYKLVNMTNFQLASNWKLCFEFISAMYLLVISFFIYGRLKVNFLSIDFILLIFKKNFAYFLWRSTWGQFNNTGV